MSPLKVARFRMGKFRVFLLTGKEGDWQDVRIEVPTPREKHKNAPCILTGGGRVVGPIEWEIRAGQMDMDFPDMPSAGVYRYVAGPEGLTMFCSTYLSTLVMKRARFETDQSFLLGKGQVALVATGTLEVEGRTAQAPLVVTAVEREKVIVPTGTITGLQLIAPD